VIESWQAMRPHPNAAFVLGRIPDYLSLLDPRPVALQLATAKGNVRGWSPRSGWETGPGFRINGGPKKMPNMYPIVGTQVREETVMVYEGGWVAIFRKGAFEVARVTWRL
jgi:hypothetical protein